mmetsp:Transcript_2129/g.2728  ORF Transcript_2129/g.2728 Transcript_2129/m.2728 type:complete len:412 (+) Transcript_2129:131-1366(+)|eukprot:CAMPEP_0204895278 /NCGR_PEP_ID=MMETSP1349-20130617/33927_1 /ASSEMBLY_ACC=CAM_ASM_000710 /TAXON_ID=215587 /ORGANISM="Aplanochytrium stocchinoi, Strain GSBS06" /LENGTH=411 /DNA_ID=CAMNT_0052062619 /DNA_START=23 /DNA_END=1258 /DNA_ORIENTATION=+
MAAHKKETEPKLTFLQKLRSPRCLVKLFLFVVVVNIIKFLSAIALIGLAYQPDYSTCTLIKEKLLLPCMEHTVTTSDGYILSLKRVGEENSELPAVLLVHGLMDSSATFAISGRNDSLTGILFDNNFDVWLLDKRGRAPWRHEEHNSQDEDFWDFSLDEIIEQDIPAAVGYITRLIGQPLASIIGHSQGGSAGLAALAESDELSKLVRSFVGLAAPLDFPLANLPLKPLPMLAHTFIYRLVHPGVVSAATRLVLNGFSTAFPRLNPMLICLLGCESTDNVATVPDVFGYYPREASYKKMNHLVQMDSSHKFQKYDYGKEGNLEKYGQEEPKAYDFSRVKTPVALFYGKYDPIASMDISSSSFLKQLPAASLKIFNDSLPYGHGDFIWGRSAKYHLYPKVIKHIQQHLNGEH